MRISLSRVRANDFAHTAGSQQGRKTCLTITGVVVDDSQIAGALSNQAVNQRAWHASAPESANHDGSAIGDTSHRSRNVRGNFVDQTHASRCARPHTCLASLHPPRKRSANEALFT
jgi:hypothetical protein